MDIKSILGYSQGSPYQNDPFIDIFTPGGLIDMSNTPKDLVGVDNKGNKKKMKAFSKNPYKFEGDTVREIPVQTGGTPIYTTDPNDPRIRAYNDSLTLYKSTLGDDKRLNTMSQKDFYDYTAKWNLLHPQAQGAYTRLSALNKKSPRGTVVTHPLRPGDAATLYKKPVQPVIYNKPYEDEQDMYDISQVDIQTPNLSGLPVNPYIQPPNFQQANPGFTSPTPTKYSFTNYDDSKTYFKSKEALQQFLKSARNASSQEGEDYMTATGYLQEGGNVYQKFYNDYMNSDVYKERLKNTGHDLPMSTVAHRLNAVNSSEIQKDYELGSTSTVPGVVRVNPDQGPVPMIASHEYAHKAGGMREGYYPNEFLNMNSRETDEFNKRNVSTKVGHLGEPDEAKADMDSLRFLMQTNGMGTPMEEMTPERLKKAKDHKDIKGTLIMDRLNKRYSDEDLLWLMNNIANRQTSANPVAKKGGNPFQKGGLQDLYSYLFDDDDDNQPTQTDVPTAPSTDELDQRERILNLREQQMKEQEQVDLAMQVANEEFSQGNPYTRQKRRGSGAPKLDEDGNPIPVNPYVIQNQQELMSKYNLSNLGIWGDKAHQQRKSDHNTGDAQDFKFDSHETADAAISELMSNYKQRNVKYIIYNGRIWNPSVSPDWRTYDGPNPHKTHFHVSYNR